MAEAAMGIKINAQLEDTEYIRNVHKYKSYCLFHFVIILLSLCVSPEFPKLL